MTNDTRQPLVSVIIPCYNQGDLLSCAISSALSQSYQNIEIVVVDDGSTDNTADVVRHFSHSVRYIYQRNGGPSKARNRAIQESRGEYIALLDADDSWRPNKLKLQIPKFLVDDKVGLVHGGFATHTGEGLSFATVPPPCDMDSLHGLLVHDYIGTLTTVFSRAVVDDVGCFDVSLQAAEDWDLWMRIAKKYKIASVPDIVADYRYEGDSQSRNSKRMFDSRMRVLTDDRAIHENCARCRESLADGRKAAHTEYAAGLCSQALARARGREFANATKLSLEAIRHDRQVIWRLLKRVIGRDLE